MSNVVNINTPIDHVRNVDTKPKPREEWWRMHGGVTNHTRYEAKTLAREKLLSAEYQQWLDERIKTRTLSEGMEKLLWSYAFGRPVEQVELAVQSTQLDLSRMSATELRTACDDLNTKVRDIEQLEKALKDADVAV